MRQAIEYEKVRFSDCSGYPSVNNEFLRYCGMKTELYPFQLEAVSKMIGAQRCYNASDMGNGKTLMALASMLALYRPFSVNVIVCPTTLMRNWRQEMIKHSRISESDIIIMMPKDVKKYRGEEYIICSYDCLGKLLPFLKGLQPRIIIADEAHYAKNYDAQRTQSFLSLCENVSIKFMLSGTPITTKATDIYSAVIALNVKGFEKYSTYRKFCLRFSEEITKYFGGRGIKMFSGAQNTDELRFKMFPQYLRFEAKEVDLPPIIEQPIPVVCSKKTADSILDMYQDAVYEKMLIENISINDLEKLAMAFSSLKKMYAICKVPETVAFVNGLLEGNKERQIVVYSDHIESAHKLAGLIKGSALITGQTSMKDRDIIVNAFQKGKITALIGTSAIAVGLTLTRADSLVINDSSWNVSTVQQLKKRIHRIGQTKRCVIYSIMMSVAEHVSDKIMPDFDYLIHNIVKKKAKMIEEASH